MGTLGDELSDEVTKTFRDAWSERDGLVIPESESLRLGNDAVKLDAVVLYADLADSTAMVDTKKVTFSAEIYKSFLHCAAKIIRSQEGTITAYDGDRIMAVYIGGSKNSNAARSALKINYAAKQIVQPALKAKYTTDFELRHVVGIDASPLFVTRAGVRGANDLVWVGRAANHAAKMAALPHAYASYISDIVYDNLAADAKFTNGSAMWEQVRWEQMGRTIYRSTWWWSI